MVHTHCFSTAIMVTRTRLSVKLQAYWMICAGILTVLFDNAEENSAHYKSTWFSLGTWIEYQLFFTSASFVRFFLDILNLWKRIPEVPSSNMYWHIPRRVFHLTFCS
jgi:hypothetical protein